MAETQSGASRSAEKRPKEYWRERKLAQREGKTTRMKNKDGVGIRKRNKGKVASQWTQTEQQEKWLDYYMDPKSPSYANAYASAIRAGYSRWAATKMETKDCQKWVAEAKNMMRLTPEHLKQQLQMIVVNDISKDADKISAIKLLGKEHNMFVDKQVTAHIGIEEALKELDNL